jgi:uncharacterized protein (DUF1330 family)
MAWLQRAQQAAQRLNYSGTFVYMHLGGQPQTSRITHVFEAGLKERTVIISFASVEAAVACYNSPAYKEALAALGDGAERDLRIVETVA